MPRNKFNILLVDDHPVYLSGLKSILRKTNYFDKIFEASNGTSAIDFVKNEKVDIILMDIEMESMNGIAATKNILEIQPNISIITLTMFCSPSKIFEMYKNGVKGYLLKDANQREINKAISMVLNNEEYFSPRVQNILVSMYRDANKNSIDFKVDKHQITPAQTEVLKLLCKQYSSEEIAEKLNISSKTVNRHRQDLLDRTGSVNLAGLVIFAIENNIFSVDSK